MIRTLNNDIVDVTTLPYNPKTLSLRLVVKSEEFTAEVNVSFQTFDLELFYYL